MSGREMSGRFESIEFDDGPRREAAARPVGEGTPVRDEEYFASLAEREFRRGRYASALRNYSRALERETALQSCWLGQVRCLLELGEYDEASVWADKALEQFPEDPDLLAGKAVASARSGRIDKAIVFSDRSVEGRSPGPFVWVARGEVLLHRRSSSAQHCFDRAATLCRDDAERAAVLLDVSRVLSRHRRQAEALLRARRAVDAAPDWAAAWLGLGDCQAALGLSDAAVSYEQAVQLDPDNEPAQARLARLRDRTLGERIRSFFRRSRG